LSQGARNVRLAIALGTAAAAIYGSYLLIRLAGWAS